MVDVDHRQPLPFGAMVLAPFEGAGQARVGLVGAVQHARPGGAGQFLHRRDHGNIEHRVVAVAGHVHHVFQKQVHVVLGTQIASKTG